MRVLVGTLTLASLVCAVVVRVPAQMMTELAPQAAAAVRAQDSPDGTPQMPTHKTAAPLKLPPPRIAPQIPLNPRERAVQMLNRFAYGPRPGEVERVLAMGPDKWLAQQMVPETVPDNALDRRLQDYPTLKLNAEQTLAIFPDRRVIEDVANGNRPYPANDPLLQSVIEVEVYKLLQERDQKRNATVAQVSNADAAARKSADQATAARIAGELFALPKTARMKALNAMSPADRIDFANNAPSDQKNTLFADFTPRERETVYAMQGGVGSAYRIHDELAQARMLRAVLSERQLQEVMTDFWFNHFNIFISKDSDQWYTTGYERDTIRPHVLGKFRDLLLATAQSPAMMIYLDNWISIGPNSVANGVDPKNRVSKQGKRGLNENYGREVMELHTVGAGGGYSQADVTHLSAILTGWSVDRPHQAGPFLYDAKKHEGGTKQWFGYTLDDQGAVLSGPALSPDVQKAIADTNAPEGMKQGVTALAILAGAPQTAHFISFLLAQRFVADQPPPALVDRMSSTYLASDGDIKAVLRTLTQSPEFNSHRYFRNKVKMPTEFLASAFRTTATEPQNPGALVSLLNNQLGQPLYKALPPTGYYVTADVWMNTQALIARLNFADQLTHNRFANQKFDSPRVLALSLMSDRNNTTAPRALRVSAPVSGPASSNIYAGSGPDVALHVLEGSLIGGDVSPSTDNFIHSQMAQQSTSTPTDTLNLLTALLLGSPEFQLR